MQYRKDKKGNELSVLGYGCMRFTRKGGAIDIEKAESEVLRAIELGVNYFDTAYLYPGSEQALGQILYDTGMRDKIYIATKLPHYMLKSMNAIEKTFSAELSRLKTDHIDYYLMHMLTDFASWQRLLDMGIEQWILNKKASGAVRNIGFSFHGNTEEFKKILDSYDWDFCQIQYNYMDEYAQAGRKGLEYAASLGIPVIIMEPLRGGKLVSSLPEEAYDIMKSSPRDWSPAQWGFRWLWNQSAVTVVLSGMNSLQQVEESAQCAENALPGELTGADLDVIDKVKSEINKKIKIPCTGCRYCMPCPHGVDIPDAFECYNRAFIDSKKAAASSYRTLTAMGSESKAASVCVSCGACEKKCPQSLPIRQYLKDVADEFETPGYKLQRFFIKTFGLW